MERKVRQLIALLLSLSLTVGAVPQIGHAAETEEPPATVAAATEPSTEIPTETVPETTEPEATEEGSTTPTEETEATDPTEETAPTEETKPTVVGPAEHPMSPARASRAKMVVPP